MYTDLTDAFVSTSAEATLAGAKAAAVATIASAIPTVSFHTFMSFHLMNLSSFSLD
jgi:hypothetical protein